MRVIKRLSYIPYIFSVFICFVILLPLGLYVFKRDYSYYSVNIENTRDNIETLLEWDVKKEMVLLEDFFNSITSKTRNDVIEKMNLSLNTFIKLIEKENKSEIQKKTGSLSFEYPIYLRSIDGEILTASKDMPDLKNAFKNRTDLSYEISDLNGNNWLVAEKNIINTVHRIGVIESEEKIENMIRELIINFVIHNNTPTLEIFILGKDGKFLANESGVFPGRILAGKDQQSMADDVVAKLLDSRKDPDGRIVNFFWKIPEMKPERVNRKKVFIKYDPGLDWFVGIGINIEELYNYEEFELFKLKKLFKEWMVKYIVFLVILFIFWLLSGIYVGRKTKSGFKIFQGFFEKANSTYEPINCSRLAFDEFRDLGGIANEMVANLKRQKEIISSYMNKLREANKILKDRSDRDGLTGIHNRRYFDEALNKAWLDAIRHKKPVSVGMIDIDFFKQYNDTYGHQMGDECLINIAGTISSVMHRPYDLAARYGGEEFVVLLPNTDSEGAMNLANIIKKAVAEKKIEHKASGVSSVITFSMGLSTIVPDRESLPEIIIKKADNALYKAKRDGRNQILMS